VLLLPAGVTFLMTADWQQPKMILKRLFLPFSALVLAFLALYNMEHLR
jgi:hypothetical protein